MSVTREDREREPFRWCVHCDADCGTWDDQLLGLVGDVEHAEDCPLVTGLYPVREDGPKCVHCGKPALGNSFCAECGVELKPGDFYVLRDEDTGEVATRPHIGLVLCVGCGASPLATSGGAP